MKAWPSNGISYVPLESMDADMRKEMERCQREGTPRPESSAVRAHVQACFWFFANSWRDLFKNGVLDHPIKELCRLYVSRSVQCDYCGNQRSVKAAGAGMIEDDVKDLLNFEKSTRYDERQKAALAYAEAIAWHLNTDDAFWERMHRHFSEAELVELGCMIGLTLGQQSWLRLLNIDHHQVLAGTTASMAPGYRTADALARSKSRPDYWAKAKNPTRRKHESSSKSVLGAALLAFSALATGAVLPERSRVHDDRRLHARQFDRHRRAHRRQAFADVGPASRYSDNRAGAGGSIGSAVVAQPVRTATLLLINVQRACR